MSVFEESCMTVLPQDNTEDNPSLTQCLVAWDEGDQAALEKLTSIVYEELYRLTYKLLERPGPDIILRVTTLIHQVYLRLVNQNDVQRQHQAHFFGVAAKAMRKILIDFARNHQAVKRGGGTREVSLDEVAPISAEQTVDLVALDDAMKDLEKFAPRQILIVELRFFGGLPVAEIAELLGISVDMVKRELWKTKIWLFGLLSRQSFTNIGNTLSDEEDTGEVRFEELERRFEEEQYWPVKLESQLLLAGELTNADISLLTPRLDAALQTLAANQRQINQDRKNTTALREETKKIISRILVNTED